MILDTYSECNYCLGGNEKYFKEKYGVQSIIELLKTDIPEDIKNRIKQTIKPRGPGETTEWLDGDNINECTLWIYRYYKDIKPVFKNAKCSSGMTFFDCKSQFQLETEERRPQYFEFKMRDTIFENRFNSDKYNCSGFVINIDWSTGCGIHWIAIFINRVLKPYTLECFDSGGGNILPEVYKYFKKMGDEYQIICVCSHAQQRDNHSCGPYSLYYIYSRLQGVPWKHFREYDIGDIQMHKFRKHLFNQMSK